MVRELQTGGSARDATRAQQRLGELAAEQREAEREAAPGVAAAPPLPPLDWRHARVGDAVAIRGGGEGRLLALPDQRGRVAVGVGGARLIVPMARVGGAAAPADAKPKPVRSEAVVRFEAGDASAAQRCDLRGLRVDEALDRLAEALDRAAALGSPSLTIVHGIGTGALREAVRRHMAESPYVARFDPGETAEGGEGVTIARLEP